MFMGGGTVDSSHMLMAVVEVESMFMGVSALMGGAAISLK
jgi:hypothetical protein